MSLPLNIEKEIIRLLQLLKSSPDYALKPRDRIILYESFGVSNHTGKYSNVKQILEDEIDQWELSLADKMLGFLAILTARKVLPIWLDSEDRDKIQSEEEYSTNPIEMLEVAEGLIDGKNNFKDVYNDINGKFYDGIGMLEDILNEKNYCVAAAAYSALTITLLGIKGLRLSPTKIFEYTDENLGYGHRDFAAYAARAYVTVDRNEAEIFRLNDSKPLEYLPLIYDHKKRLEFWEWWLTEAIPQAWELAQQSVENK